MEKKQVVEGKFCLPHKQKENREEVEMLYMKEVV